MLSTSLPNSGDTDPSASATWNQAGFPKSRHAASALYYQGESLYLAGALADAVTAYQKAIAAYPGDALQPELHYALGTAQQELERI